MSLRKMICSCFVEYIFFLTFSTKLWHCWIPDIYIATLKPMLDCNPRDAIYLIKLRIYSKNSIKFVKKASLVFFGYMKYSWFSILTFIFNSVLSNKMICGFCIRDNKRKCENFTLFKKEKRRFYLLLPRLLLTT